MTTDVSERGLERIICTALTGGACDPGTSAIGEPPAPYGGAGYICGSPADYDREYAVDLGQLGAFLNATQPAVVEAADLGTASPTRQKFLNRVQGETTRRGTIDVLRKGIKHGQHDITLFYPSPTPGNAKAEERYALNRFSVTRQLRYSRDETQLSLDLAIFVNGLPIATFELKNNLTKQTLADAVRQYKDDRDERELLFGLGRCIAHFALDDQQVAFCTRLSGDSSWFLPFDRGWNDGAGNPPNPDGVKTDYLWKRILTRDGLTDIIENYAQLVEMRDPKFGKRTQQQVFPRFHQLDVVRKLLADAEAHGVGRRYLIQHSAGSGKSNSIAWLAHQLIGVKQDGKEVFDSIIVVTDRRLLDKQIRDTIRAYSQVKATVGHAEGSGDLRAMIEGGKKIIITTIQKFPFVVNAIGDEHRGRTFAIVIDEAHSSQGGRVAGKLNATLSGVEDPEDEINRAMEARKMLTNASYFAFTATPKNKTLEIFGTPEPQPDGKVRHRPFHSYTMKQAIQEGFIEDVLANYAPVDSYYRLVKTVDEDPEVDTKRTKAKLRKYVEGHDHAIRLKAEIMVDHFHEQVLAAGKIGGQARAMVVTSGIERAIAYHVAIRDYLVARKSPYMAIVAFSGEHLVGGKKVTEADLNRFPSRDIPDVFVEDPYRFLVVADKFQTGYDEPLLHTMYVDKPLSGVKAVQTLSRLNRAHPLKHDVFVLDFKNDTETIEAAFADYYRTTILSEETDPNKLHDLKADLDSAGVYTQVQVDELVRLFMGGAPRETLDPILDLCAATYRLDLDEDQQVAFKGDAKAFTRTYAFLASILPYTNAEWEKLSIFLEFLVPKLPAPIQEDLSKGVLEAIDMDSYRAEKQAAIKIALPDEDAEIGPVPADGGGSKLEPELDHLSNIIKSFNDLWGNTNFTDKDRVDRLIASDIPARVAEDPSYRNARKNSDSANARVEMERALAKVMVGLVRDDTDLYRLFTDNADFKQWLTAWVFNATFE